jgi:hypothetical protein
LTTGFYVRKQQSRRLRAAGSGFAIRQRNEEELSMYLRKLFSVIGICVLACGLFACGKQRGEPYEPKYNGDAIPVRKADVEVSGKVTNGGFLALLERMRGHEYRPLDKSHVVSRQQSYRGHWARVAYYAFPRFTNELDGAGAKAIKAYYKAQAAACAAPEGFPWLDGIDEIADSPEQVMQYQLQVYAVELTDGYVSVEFYTESYLGGAKNESARHADVFDRAAGRKLALGDVVDVAAAAQAINKAVADHLRVADIRARTPYDVTTAQQAQDFSVTSEGITLLFAPDTLASPAYGPISVPVKWAALG